MTRTQLICSIAIILLITVAGGSIHGRLTERWGAGDQASQAALALESLPDRFGSWLLVARNEWGQSELDMLRPYGYQDRTYVNLDTGLEVNLFVLLGPVGQTAVHTPEVCYSSREYAVVQEKEPVTIEANGQGADQFYAMTFQRRSLDSGLLRVYYGWSTGTRFEAASGGRVQYARFPYLYKLQLAVPVPTITTAGDPDPHPGQLLLHDLLPVLRTHMIPAHPRSWLP